jgi:pimeloyl-ACP methyl ester carboxylesterase
MFRNLIPLLADRFHIVAPDLPGFGFSQSPPRSQFKYTFDNLAKAIGAFTETIDLKRYALYVFDYGAPVGFRLAVAHPERVTAIVSQNGNAYEEGLSDAWDPIRRYWAEPTTKNREIVRDALLTFEGTRWQYTQGVADPESVAPESYTLDAALLERPGNKDIQLDLFLDYASNLTLYPVFQKYFSDAKPPLLAIWGKHDPFFIPAGAEAYRRDNPNAVVEFLDTGHFALETHFEKIAGEIGRLMDRASNRAQTQRSKQ